MRIGEKVVEIFDGREGFICSRNQDGYVVEFKNGEADHFAFDELMTLADWSAAGSANNAEARNEARQLGGE